MENSVPGRAIASSGNTKATMGVPVERVFLSEAMRVGVGTYAPHDPTTADIADLVGSIGACTASAIPNIKQQKPRRRTMHSASGLPH